MIIMFDAASDITGYDRRRSELAELSNAPLHMDLDSFDVQI